MTHRVAVFKSPPDPIGQEVETRVLSHNLRRLITQRNQVIKLTRQRVYDQSNGRQFPAVYDGLLGEIVLRSGPASAPPPAFAAAPPAPSLAPSAPPPMTGEPAGSGAMAGAGEVRFELAHFRNTWTSAGFDPGVLTLSPGRVTWSETGETTSTGGPDKGRKTRSDRDDFDATCDEIDRVEGIRNVNKVDKFSGGVWVHGRKYDLFAIELVKGKRDYVLPRPYVLDAIRTACPNVTVK